MNPIAQIKFGKTWYNNLKVSEMILNQLENFPEEGHLLCHREIFKEISQIVDCPSDTVVREFGIFDSAGDLGYYLFNGYLQNKDHQYHTSTLRERLDIRIAIMKHHISKLKSNGVNS